MRIDIRGVIVPSEYDVDFLFGYIKKGLITPESYVRKLIAQNEDDTIDLYINSQGGSVFAGNEMINALQDWVAENEGTLNITVGALAASMGSAILVTLAPMAKSVKIHSNTKLMFHGAFGGAVGGSEAMKDYSEVLEKINSDIKVKLVSNYNMSPEVVEGWFKEGREGWLTSAEALEIGIADEIIGEDAEVPENPEGLDGALNDSGFKIAARALNKYKHEDTVMEKLMAKLKKMLGITEEAEDATVFELLDQIEQVGDAMEEIDEDPKAEAEKESEESEEVIEDEDSGEGTEDAEESADTPESDDDNEEDSDAEELAIDAVDIVDHMEEVEDVICDCQEKEAKIEVLDALNRKMQSDNDKLRSDNEQLALRLEKLLGTGLIFDVETEAPTDWKSCLKECDGDYVEARKQFPEVYANMMGK